MPTDPGDDLFGGLRSVVAEISESTRREAFDGTYPAVKSYLIGCPSALALGPVVGGKRRKMGAVCNIS